MAESAGNRQKNRQVAELLDEIGDLLEVKGEVRFKYNAYHTAARRIESLTEPIEQIHAQKRLRSIPGVGDALEQKIGELLDTGSLAYIERLRAEIPPSLLALTRVPGLGPRKAFQLYQQLGISTLDDLEQAVREHRLSGIAGMGGKMEEKLLRELDRLKDRSQRFMYPQALDRAEVLLAELRRHPGVEGAEYAGSLRRKQETVGDLDLLAATNDPESVHALVRELPQVKEVVATGLTKTSVLIAGGLQVDIRTVPPDSFGAALQYFTGSKEHNVQLRELAVRRKLRLNEYGLFDAQGVSRAGVDEAEIYAAMGMDCPPPELRQGRGEIQAAQKHALPNLVTVDAVRGDLHVHTNWTDGAHSLEQMAETAIALGRSYMALTDHSRSLRVANGLDVDRLRLQRGMVDRLNSDLAPFRILLGTEMDILVGGELDYPDSVLDALDYVSASIHSHMKQPGPEMTARICRALENPRVVTFNHPHGRIFNKREEYAVDMDAVIETAVKYGVALEVNSQPHRMDLSGEWVKCVIDRGGRITISSDAHSTAELEFLPYGVMMARRGWAEPQHVLNALPLEGFQEHVARKLRVKS
jgi:DNA polymerase (family 10)